MGAPRSIPGSAHGAAWRDVRRSEADRIVGAIGAALRVVRRPASSVLEQSNGANPPFLAQIEPVPRPARHAQQVARFHRNGNDVSFARMNMEQSAPFDDESYFVFI